MLSLFKSLGILPVLGKVAGWLIDKFIDDHQERELAKKRLRESINKAIKSPYSEVQAVSDQWSTIKEDDDEENETRDNLGDSKKETQA